jgi:hypothetical protein
MDLGLKAHTVVRDLQQDTPRSIATVSVSGTLEEKLRAIAAAHFSAAELFEGLAAIPTQIGLAIAGLRRPSPPR